MNKENRHFRLTKMKKTAKGILKLIKLRLCSKLSSALTNFLIMKNSKEIAKTKTIYKKYKMK